ncbi:hypothetical protein GJAV_G00040140 [Gymnothorax javanicus]|nr:hypothetical protein GJAV_G00040140 [Gymnothorax javanicus]
MKGWHHGNGNISMSQTWQLEFEVEGAGSKQAFIAIDDIVISSYSCPPPETKCTLESGLCGWLNTQANDQLDWEVTSTAEERHYSTPPFDRTLQSVRGHFLLLPSSQRDTVGQEAWLLSPHLPPTLGTCLRFWVHKDDGGLKVVRMVGNTQELLLSVGDVSEVWRKFDTNIMSSEAYQIVFQGVKGQFGSLALDDIQYTPGVNCAGQNTDPKPLPPGDDTGGLAASVIVTLLLMVTLAGLLAFYLYWRKNLEPASKDAQPSARCGISNQAYDPSTGDHVAVPPMSGKPEDSSADLANTEEREIV